MAQRVAISVLLCLALLLPLNLINVNQSMKRGIIPDAYAQATTLPYFPNLYDPYYYYYNQFNFNRNPFFTTNPTSTALSTLVNAPLGPPFGHQHISPWFPSIPAIACGAGLFSFTITGVPDKDVNIPIAKDHNDKEKNLVSLQVIRDNNRFRIFDDDVQGQIAVGEKNIERQKWKDFEVEDLFNTCRTLAYSSSPDVNKNIKTPLPTLALSEDGVPITPLLAAFAINRNVYNSYGQYYSTTTTDYPYTSPYYPTSSSYPATSSGGCSSSYPDVCIPNPPPQLACEQVQYTNFRVLPPDPHRFDENRDGRGCER